MVSHCEYGHHLIESASCHVFLTLIPLSYIRHPKISPRVTSTKPIIRLIIKSALGTTLDIIQILFLIEGVMLMTLVTSCWLFLIVMLTSILRINVFWIHVKKIKIIVLNWKLILKKNWIHHFATQYLYFCSFNQVH